MEDRPKEVVKRLKNRLRFVRNASDGKKLVKRSLSYEMYDLGTGEPISIESSYVNILCENSQEAVCG